MAEDRTAAIQQLVPGTDQYYFYQCLHLQNNGQHDEVRRLLVQWQQRHGETTALREIRNRMMLLTYGQSPKTTLDYLIRELQPNLHHQREQLNEKPELPNTLDGSTIRFETLKRKALREHKGLEGFHDRSLHRLRKADLDPLKRRQLLARLHRPTHPELIDLIVADLNYKGSRGFGSLNIHERLTIAQLDELVSRKPALENQTPFVHAYLRKLRPSADADCQRDTQELESYLSRLWKFASGLNASHNSLKAHVLYHWLDLDNRLGKLNRRRFLQYLALPRQSHYVSARLMEDAEARRHPVDFAWNADAVSELAPIGNDEPLVRSILLQLLTGEKNFQSYEPFIRTEYLQHLFAEAQITAGVGDPVQWYSFLPPEQYKALKDRVDLDFAPTNPRAFRADEPVHLDLFVKNVRKLFVKVYEVNTQNYYRKYQREVNTDIQLDGLVPNEETIHTYDLPPERRERRHFEFPDLERPGVYVIDFIGNGKSSRVVVRKGRLDFVHKVVASGHAFSVFDDSLKPLPHAVLWMSGRQYEANDRGQIIVPFSTNPKRQSMILTHGNLSSLHFFQHESEDYELRVAMHLDRESLLLRKEAAVLLRPELRLAGAPVSLRALEDVRVTIRTVSESGINAEKTYDDVQLQEHEDTPLGFRVPHQLVAVEVTVTANVTDAHNRTHALSDTHEVAVNGIDRTTVIEDVHLTRLGNEYVLQVLGKSGEPKPYRPIRVELTHGDFKTPIAVDLSTDASGVVRLGMLPDIVRLAVPKAGSDQHFRAKHWPILRDRRTHPRIIHGQVGEAIQVPHMLTNAQLDSEDASLYELRGGSFAFDRSNLMRIQEHFIELRNLLPGDYSLQVGSDVRHQIRITDGPALHQYALGQHRHLELRRLRPLQLAEVGIDDQHLSIQLRNVSDFTRVHVLATRFVPAFDAFASLSKIGMNELAMKQVGASESYYMAGRELGDELRYVFERAYAKKFPGNMLQRPTLLLNSWPVRTTETDTQEAAPGAAFEAAAAAPSSRMSRQARLESEEDEGLSDFANLDFLAEHTVLLTNLVPNEDGKVLIPAKQLGPHQHVHVLAVDPLTTVSRTLAMTESAMPFRDLALRTGLSPAQHFTQQKQSTVLHAGETFQLDDIATGRFDTYDSLRRVYQLLSTLSQDTELAQFQFILDWPQLTTDDKREKYSEFACHELNFFIYQKDPEFFQSVVRPYLKNKHHRTFLDEWLLEYDLQKYLQPWEYSQLNVVERILLAQRIEGEDARTRRTIGDLFSIMPHDVSFANTWFETAIQGGSLDTKDQFGLYSQLRELTEEEALFEQVDRLSTAGDASFGFRAKTEAFGDDDADESRQLGRKSAGGRPRLAESAGDSRRYFFQARADSAMPMYVQLERTREWAENNYYRVQVEQQNADLVRLNTFWHDYAMHDTQTPFLSAQWPAAHTNFSEMMFVLSVLDLPFEAGEHSTEYKDGQMTLAAASPMVIFQQQIREAESPEEASQILVSQNYFQQGDRYRIVAGDRQDKFITDEFLTHTVYGCQVVVTNPTSNRQSVQLLVQIPHQSIPTNGGKATKTVSVDLDPFRTETVEYFFYFPSVGQVDHFPVHVAKEDVLLGFAQPARLNVVAQPTNIDTQSWDYVSQFASDEDILRYLREHNVFEIDLERIAFRMKDQRFFSDVVALLADRHAYNHTLWAYGLVHNHRDAIESYLKHSPEFLNGCGKTLVSDLLQIEPVERRTYQHLDYKPLVNARAHQLGDRRRILNDRFHQQYHRLLSVLRYQPALTSDDQLAMTYYLLLQDRVEEAIEMFGAIHPSDLDTHLQYDYFAAYLDCFQDVPKVAPEIVTRYANYPVLKWRQAFSAISSVLAEMEGGEALVVDQQDRNQKQTAAASEESVVDFHVENEQIHIAYQNVDHVQVNYYVIDLELLFSSNPFVQQFRGQFSHIRPNQSDQIPLPTDESEHLVPLPADLRNQNVLVEVVANGTTRSQPYFSNSITVQMAENHGQLKVTEKGSGRPVSKTYVKVYAETNHGGTVFYKDGYTDLRGRFDYSSLSTNELDQVKRFSLLVLDESRGGLVREAMPPKR